jgi:hypothetical protein
LKCEKFTDNRQQTPSDGNSSHGPLVGPGELKTKVLLPQVTIADFGYPVWSLWFKRKNIWLFNPFAWSAPDGVIPETCRAHFIRYLNFYWLILLKNSFIYTKSNQPISNN